MGRLDSGFTAGSEEALDALVPERLNHGPSVARRATDHKNTLFPKIGSPSTRSDRCALR